MPILNLDHNMRLNLTAILDGLECAGRREAYAVCRLQERIDLNDKERETVGLKKMQTPDGRDYMMWQPKADVPVKPYDLPEADVERICRALDNYRVVLGRDRMWWEPLMAQLPSPVEGNGDARTAGATAPPQRKPDEIVEAIEESITRGPTQPQKKEKVIR